MRILIVDDDKVLNEGISSFLESQNYDIHSAVNPKEALSLMKAEKFNLILSDIQMPEMSGIEFLEKIKSDKIEIPIIMMTAFASVENAVKAMKIGADDYLTKPVNLHELLIKIQKIVKVSKLKNDNERLKEKIKNYELPDIIGESEQIKELKTLLKRIANNSDVPVNIFGKSGTGKELVAKNIHYMSERKDKSFFAINCAGLKDDLLESELFGYAKGAFTGAEKSKKGLFEICDGGTIFLDEISEMSITVQAKLLRVLQDNLIQPIGSNNQIKIDVRFICASNQRLEDLVANGKFREDLFYRINVVEVELPTLLARKTDIPILTSYFLKKHNADNVNFDKEALIILKNYDWPGNIRELENLIRMLLVTCSDNKITSSDLPDKIKTRISSEIIETSLLKEEYKIALNQTIENFDRNYLLHHLKENGFNISKTSDAINLSRVSLHKKIQEYSIQL